LATTPPLVRHRPSMEQILSRPGTTSFASTVESHHTYTSHVHTRESEASTTTVVHGTHNTVSIETAPSSLLRSSTSLDHSSKSTAIGHIGEPVRSLRMLKVSAKKQHSRVFKLDLEHGRIHWDSRKIGKSKRLLLPAMLLK
jgi:hypothetical protein